MRCFMAGSSGDSTGGNQPPPQQPALPLGTSTNPLFFVRTIARTNDPPPGSESNPLHIKQVEEASTPSTQPEEKTNSWLVVGALVALAILIIGISVSLILRQYIPATAFIVIAIGELIGLLIYLGYTNFTWTGFAKYIGKEDRDHQPKLLWDWLTLLIIPIVLAAGALGFGAFQNQENYNLSQSQFQLAATQYVNDQNIAATRYAEDQNLALGANFQSYLDSMSSLLLNPNLHHEDPQTDNVKVGANVRILARARTLTILPTLDLEQKAALLKFLEYGGLINQQDPQHPEIVNPVVNLNGADFSGVNLSNFDLRGADLAVVNFSKAILNNADLSGAYLMDANLSYALLQNAHLCFTAIFGHANLSGADFSKALLGGANLIGADMSNAILNGTNLGTGDPTCHAMQKPTDTLNGADMTNANLHGAHLKKADLTGAKLINANLTNADLTGASYDTTNFTNVTWKHTTCADTTNSDSHNPISCEGH